MSRSVTTLDRSVSTLTQCSILWLRLNRAVVKEKPRLVAKTAVQETGIAYMSAWTMAEMHKLMEECWLKLKTTYCSGCLGSKRQQDSLGSNRQQDSLSSNRQQHRLGSNHQQDSIGSDRQQEGLGSKRQQDRLGSNRQQVSLGT